MAHQAEDISKIEDIGERLDALLDALEESSEEVARASGTGDSTSPPKLRPSTLPSADSPSAEAEVDSEDSDVDPGAESVAQPDSLTEPEPEDAAVVDSIDEPEPEAASDSENEVVSADVEPEAEPEMEPESVVDDGLLIEPEGQAPPASDDIDGAPVGPVDLESELDEELASLLASGVFEDPVGEMGIDESADPVELPEDDAEASADSETLAPAVADERRKPNLPTEEAELIGELDEQLAALADAQLTADEDLAPEPEPSFESPGVEDEALDEPEQAEPAPAQAPAEQPEPVAEVVTAPTAPAPTAKPRWRAIGERVIATVAPIAARVAERTGHAMVASAKRMSAPLDNKPQIKQIVGWVALVQAFLATCVWVYLALWHNPPEPKSTPQPTLERPADG